MSRLWSGALAAAFGLVVGACTVEQTEEGSPPEFEPGEAPAYEIQPADVDVEWDTSVVRVPDVDVTPQQDTTGVEPRTR